MSELVIRGGTILTVDEHNQVLVGDIHVVNGTIQQVGGQATPQSSQYDVLDATGCIVMPGLVQTHVHTCQTLARGHADGLELLDWLAQVVWPYEAALERDDIVCAAKLAALELIRGGTTCIQDMGTVHHTDAIFEVLGGIGMRATIGKALMDTGANVPSGLLDNTEKALSESVDLCQRYHDSHGGRIRYAFAPRFALSCSDGLLRETCSEASRLGAQIHTHASENQGEIQAVRDLRGDDNVEYLHKVGMTGRHVGLAHCIWLSDTEEQLLVDTGTHLLHCPSSNLKLASGTAKVPELAARGASVSLGADGAPCNNNLDGFWEMRLAALLHKPRCGPKAMPAHDVVRMATIGGARALGIDGKVGSLEVGKQGDVIVVDPRAAHVVPTQSPYSAIVYACQSRDVVHTVVDGRILMRDRNVPAINSGPLLQEANQRAQRIFTSL